jgi:anti-sigma factor RsiW
MTSPADIPCNELVELVTEYLDGALSEADRVRFEQHLVICGGCAAHVDQMRVTREALGALRDRVGVEPDVRARLLQAFRERRSS